jgi:hypothetical protein
MILPIVFSLVLGPEKCRVLLGSYLRLVTGKELCLVETDETAHALAIQSQPE